MFSALCGLPLQPASLMSHNSLEFSRDLLEGGPWLIDLLSAQGWDISCYGGASLKFAGKVGIMVVNGRLSCRSPLFQRLWMKAP